MRITNFGIIWTIVLFVAAIKGSRSLIKTIVFSSIFQAGAVIVVGTKASLSPLACSCIVYCLRYVFVNIKKKHIIRVPSWFGFFMAMWGVLVISSIIASVSFIGMKCLESKDWIEYVYYDGHIAIYGLLTYLIFGITLLIIFQERELDDRELDKLLSIMIMIVFAILAWQYLSIMNYIPRNSFITDLIYSNSATKENIAYFIDIDPTKRKYPNIFGIRAYSCFMESSYLGGFVGAMFTYYISKKEYTMTDKLLIMIVLIMAIMTFSVTAYLTVFAGGVLASLSSGRIKHFLKIVLRGGVLIGIGILVISYANIWNVIVKLIINKTSTYSAYIRGLWNKNCFEIFLKTYTNGLGFSNVRGSSIFPTMLASFGLIGTLLFFGFFIKMLYTTEGVANSVYFEKEHNVYKMMCVVTFLAQLIAVPNMDYPIFWMVCILMLSRCKGISRRKLLLSHAILRGKSL